MLVRDVVQHEMELLEHTVKGLDGEPSCVVMGSLQRVH